MLCIASFRVGRYGQVRLCKAFLVVFVDVVAAVFLAILSPYYTLSPLPFPLLILPSWS